MAGELGGAVKQLVVLLQRYFVPSGIPPRPAELSFRLPFHRHITMDDHIDTQKHAALMRETVSSFASLISDPLDPYAVKIMKAAPPLAEIAAVARDIRAYLDSEPVRGRICYLYEKFIEMQVVTEINVRWSLRHSDEGEALTLIFKLTPIGSQFLHDLAAAGDEGQTIALVLKPDHEEQEILDLIRSVGHRLTTDKILSEFNKRGNPKALSTTKAKLSSLVKKGLLRNTHLHKPRGYGLPEW